MLAAFATDTLAGLFAETLHTMAGSIMEAGLVASMVALLAGFTAAGDDKTLRSKRIFALRE